MFDDDGGGGIREIAQNVEGVVGVRQVGLAGVLAGLQQFDVRCQVATRLDGLGIGQRQVAVDQAVKRGFLPGIFAVAQAFGLPVDRPGHPLVEERLAVVVFANKGNLHPRRKMVLDDGAIHLL